MFSDVSFLSVHSVGGEGGQGGRVHPVQVLSGQVLSRSWVGYILSKQTLPRSCLGGGHLVRVRVKDRRTCTEIVLISNLYLSWVSPPKSSATASRFLGLKITESSVESLASLFLVTGEAAGVLSDRDLGASERRGLRTNVCTASYHHRNHVSDGRGGPQTGNHDNLDRIAHNR